jgi:hypothetical protein
MTTIRSENFDGAGSYDSSRLNMSDAITQTKALNAESEVLSGLSPKARKGEIHGIVDTRRPRFFYSMSIVLCR